MLQALGAGSHGRPILADSVGRGGSLSCSDGVVLDLLAGLLELLVDHASSLDDQGLGQRGRDVERTRMELEGILVDADLADEVHELPGVIVGGHVGVGDDDGLVLAEINAAKLADMSSLVLPHQAWTVHRRRDKKE